MASRAFSHPQIKILCMLFPDQDIIPRALHNNQQILEGIVVSQANFQDRSGCHLGQGGFT